MLHPVSSVQTVHSSMANYELRTLYPIANAGVLEVDPSMAWSSQVSLYGLSHNAVRCLACLHTCCAQLVPARACRG